MTPQDRDTDRIHAIEDESWNAALAAVEEVVATQSGLDVRIDRELLPLDDATFAVPIPPATVTVTNGPPGQLINRPALLSAIAALRKPGAEVARGDALRTEVISAVTNHLRTGCEDTPKEACAEAIWLDIEDRLRRHVTDPVVAIEAREEAEMDTAIFHARLAADANAVAGRPDPTAAALAATPTQTGAEGPAADETPFAKAARLAYEYRSGAEVAAAPDPEQIAQAYVAGYTTSYNLGPYSSGDVQSTWRSAREYAAKVIPNAANPTQADPGWAVERLAGMAVMALGTVLTGNDYKLYHELFKARFVERLNRADEYLASKAKP